MVLIFDKTYNDDKKCIRYYEQNVINRNRPTLNTTVSVLANNVGQGDMIRHNIVQNHTYSLMNENFDYDQHVQKKNNVNLRQVNTDGHIVQGEFWLKHGYLYHNYYSMPLVPFFSV